MKVHRHMGHTLSTKSRYYRHAMQVDEAFEAFDIIKAAYQQDKVVKC